ncbi:choline transporter-like protein 1 [Dermatophagoides pteronyssinus]|uniref:choline transporter-like protein 1 n=1 Tax=Dermatophagoides pteronyssinus TaxID=6956 RepID=UPI003F677934
MFCCQNSDEVHPAEKVRRRGNHCTDKLFAIVFVLYLCGLGAIAYYAFQIGNPLRMIHGSDSFGNICGQKNEKIDDLPFTGLDLRNRPNLFHLNQRDPKNSIKICVKKCPNRDLVNMAEIYQFYTRYNASLCRYDFEFNTTMPTSSPLQISQLYPTLDQLQDQSQTSITNDTGLCPTLPVFKNRRLLYYCLPEMAIIQGVALGHTIYEFMSSRVPLKKIVGDVINSHEEMIVMGVVAILASFITVFCIHFVASLASWLILVVISALLLSLTILLWWIYFMTRNGKLLPEKLAKLLPEDSENESIVLTVAIISTIVTLVIIYAASSMRSHVKFVVALFQETGACIRTMPLILIQPLWTLLALIAFLVIWLFILMALATSDQESRDQRMLQTTNDNDLLSVGSAYKNKLTSFTLIRYKDSSGIQFMWWYLLIAFIWISEFLCSCQQLIIAGAVSSWYFSRDRENLGFPILNATRDLVCCHIGSVALGSFLITAVKLPRLIIQQTTARLRRFEEYRLARTALNACGCCLWVVEKFLTYLTRNAYTMVVLRRTNFCVSARLAFQTLFSNTLRVTAINSIGDFILFLGKLIVASLTAIVGVFLIRSNTAIHYWMVPVLIMTMFAFWIAHCLLSVYEMIIDAMFLCFCHDMNQHDGSPGNEYYAPESLRRFLHEDEQTMSEIRPNQTVSMSEDEPDIKRQQPGSQQGMYPDLHDYQTIR